MFSSLIGVSTLRQPHKQLTLVVVKTVLVFAVPLPGFLGFHDGVFTAKKIRFGRRMYANYAYG